MEDENSLLVSEELVFLNLDCTDSAEVIRFMSGKMLEKGLVKDTFPAAVLSREKKFPTALPTPIPVSFPHTDVSHCLVPAIAVATLAHPVQFGFMGDPDISLDVKIVFMLSVTQPPNQVKTLQKLIDFCQNEQNLTHILEADQPNQISNALRSLFGSETKPQVGDSNSPSSHLGTVAELVINHPAGMHARPASLFVKTASKFPCQILVARAEQPEKAISAKSILSLLSLGIRQGERILIQAKGPDCHEAVKSLVSLVQNNFAEEEETS